MGLGLGLTVIVASVRKVKDWRSREVSGLVRVRVRGRVRGRVRVRVRVKGQSNGQG